ncbi:hypothetical protein EJB05_26617, partial [Eragrostis curvula]
MGAPPLAGIARRRRREMKQGQWRGNAQQTERVSIDLNRGGGGRPRTGDVLCLPFKSQLLQQPGRRVNQTTARTRPQCPAAPPHAHSARAVALARAAAPRRTRPRRRTPAARAPSRLPRRAAPRRARPQRTPVPPRAPLLLLLLRAAAVAPVVLPIPQ